MPRKDVIKVHVLTCKLPRVRPNPRRPRLPRRPPRGLRPGVLPRRGPPRPRPRPLPRPRPTPMPRPRLSDPGLRPRLGRGASCWLWASAAANQWMTRHRCHSLQCSCLQVLNTQRSLLYYGPSYTTKTRHVWLQLARLTLVPLAVMMLSVSAASSAAWRVMRMLSSYCASISSCCQHAVASQH